MSEQQEKVGAGLLRRLGAIVYDTLLVIAVLMVITFLFVPFLQGRVLVPQEVGALAYLYWLVQIAAVVTFFGYFWTRRGQTAGMLAWRLRLEQTDGANVSWPVALKRMGILIALLIPFFAGDWLIWREWSAPQRRLMNGLALLPLAASYLWVWIDRDRRALHDRWSQTRVVLLPKARR
ncbi:MAG: RDD family protein [Gammaproteobacteria bacterium]|nr:hypothetical protein [Gammaproteobacteria bacterium]